MARTCHFYPNKSTVIKGSRGFRNSPDYPPQPCAIPDHLRNSEKIRLTAGCMISGSCNVAAWACRLLLLCVVNAARALWCGRGIAEGQVVRWPRPAIPQPRGCEGRPGKH